MQINRPQAKQAAKDLMRTARVSPYQIGLVYVLATLLLNAADSFVTTMFSVQSYYDWYNTGMQYVVTIPEGPAWFVTILVSLISTVLSAGFACYCLGIRRGKEMPLSTLFDGFNLAGKIILLEIVTSIFIFLWALLFVIPGIIASYRYRFALYNLLENPDLGIMEAIELSKQQTNGYKWQLFVMDLSFLGWQFLSVCTAGLLLIWLMPYMTLTNIAFYDIICAQKGLDNNDWNTRNERQEPVSGQFDHDWDAQNQRWESAPAPEDTSAENQNDAPSSYHYDDASKPLDAPATHTDSEPWKRPEDTDPWNRNK